MKIFAFILIGLFVHVHADCEAKIDSCTNKYGIYLSDTGSSYMEACYCLETYVECLIYHAETNLNGCGPDFKNS